MPNHLVCAPRMFTKILKPAFAHQGERGHGPVLPIALLPLVSFGIADSEDECRASASAFSQRAGSVRILHSS